MSRQRLIAAIGEALMIEEPEEVHPGGLAIDAALQAGRFGHVGIPISRIGQDERGSELLNELSELNVDLEHLQHDPDLPTGRLLVRSMLGRVQCELSDYAAFDHLQWDFDLEDIAQRADAAIVSVTGCRNDQARSEIERFLASAISAVRVFDMTCRYGEPVPVRSVIDGPLELAQVVVVDDEALHAAMPAAGSQEQREAMTGFLRANDLLLAVHVSKAGVVLHSRDEAVETDAAIDDQSRPAMLVALLHGLLAGWSLKQISKFIDTVDRRSLDDSLARLPDELLSNPGSAA